MEHADQHTEAIQRTLRVTNEVSASIFDDKVKEMGRVAVSGGKVAITLDYLPSMVSEEATQKFVVEAISLALRACIAKRPTAFDPHSY